VLINTLEDLFSEDVEYDINDLISYYEQEEDNKESNEDTDDY
jgi:hypothetical protein